MTKSKIFFYAAALCLPPVYYYCMIQNDPYIRYCSPKSSGLLQGKCLKFISIYMKKKNHERFKCIEIFFQGQIIQFEKRRQKSYFSCIIRWLYNQFYGLLFHHLLYITVFCAFNISNFCAVLSAAH